MKQRVRSRTKCKPCRNAPPVSGVIGRPLAAAGGRMNCARTSGPSALPCGDTSSFHLSRAYRALTTDHSRMIPRLNPFKHTYEFYLHTCLIPNAPSLEACYQDRFHQDSRRLRHLFFFFNNPPPPEISSLPRRAPFPI